MRKTNKTITDIFFFIINTQQYYNINNKNDKPIIIFKQKTICQILLDYYNAL